TGLGDSAGVDHLPISRLWARELENRRHGGRLDLLAVLTHVRIPFILVSAACTRRWGRRRWTQPTPRGLRRPGAPPPPPATAGTLRATPSSRASAHPRAARRRCS